MIARSDLVIIVVSASLLATGIVRWQLNLSSPAPARVAGTAAGPGSGTDRLTATPGASGNAGSARIDNPVQVTAAPDVIRSAADAGFSAVFTSTSTTAPSTGPEASGETRSRVVSGTAAAERTAGATDPSENSPTASTAVSGNDASSDPLYGVYIVKPGDYLGRIAQTYGTTVATLQRINDIEGSLIDVDQRILYPLPAN